jgi:phosphotriesterase-related protein
VASSVETVTGPIDAAELRTTLIHEHLRTRDEAVHIQWPQASTLGTLPEQNVEAGGELDAAIRAANAALELGVKTIADPTAMFLGRDVEFMREVSERTGLQVVPCTGIYTYEHLPQFFVLRDADAMAEFFVADIEEGIQGTDIKAAFIKCAADEPGVTENVEKVHRAVARASVQTGAPIMAHSRPASETAPRQIEIFEEEGVDLSLVQIAHTGDTDDLDYIERVLDKGVYIGMDRFGLAIFLPDEKRIPTVLALLERGYADRMFLSADSNATIDWYPFELAEQLIAAGMAVDWTIKKVPEKVIPALRDGGMSDDQLETMMVENPRRWLAG